MTYLIQGRMPGALLSRRAATEEVALRLAHRWAGAGMIVGITDTETGQSLHPVDLEERIDSRES